MTDQEAIQPEQPSQDDDAVRESGELVEATERVEAAPDVSVPEGDESDSVDGSVAASLAQGDSTSAIEVDGEAESDSALPVTPMIENEPEAAAGHAGSGHEMTFIGHLQELRVRLTRCLIAMFIGLLACYGFAEQLFNKLMEPLVVLLEPSGGSLIYTGLAEAFFTQLKVAGVAGLFVVSPYIFYQLWMFIAPGLYEGERKWIVPIAICSAACFITGAMFGYYVVFPVGFQFFLGFATDFIKPMPSVKEYFSFSISMLFAFGFIFELPLFMLFLSSLGIVTYKTMRKWRKYAILGNFIVAAILTPPDVVSQCLMAGPLCLLYEVGILVSYLFGKKPKEPAVEEDVSQETHA